MAHKGQIYFCEICKQKVVVVEEGFGVLVCCGKEMTLIQAGSIADTWTSAYHKPEGGATFVCEICGQKIKVVFESTGTLECCGQKMQRIETASGV